MYVDYQHQQVASSSASPNGEGIVSVSISTPRDDVRMDNQGELGVLEVVRSRDSGRPHARNPHVIVSANQEEGVNGKPTTPPAMQPSTVLPVIVPSIMFNPYDDHINTPRTRGKKTLQVQQLTANTLRPHVSDYSEKCRLPRRQ